MTARSRFLSAVLLGLGWALPASAEPPGGLQPGTFLPDLPAPTNQQTADRVAATLQQSGQLHGYRVEIAFQDGTADLTGVVADQPQREEVLRLVQGVPGVERVRDRLTLAGAVQAVQATVPPAPLPPPTPQPPSLPPPVPDTRIPPGPALPEPAPVFQAPPGPHDLNPPRMPPYAWPTYAPYNNFSRVAYPEAYPYNAWPYIGPCYPFPKVPPGWRSVKLEWDDGYWWYSRTATKYDWWKLRYW